MTALGRLTHSGAVGATALVATAGRILRPFVPKGRRIEAVRDVLEPVRPGSSVVGRDLYGGRFRFAGSVVECAPRNIFAETPPSVDWLRELRSFDWLDDLRACGSELHRGFARALVSMWARRGARGFHDAWDQRPIRRRLLALSFHASFLMQDGSPDFASDLHDIVDRDIAFLSLTAGGPPAGRLESAMAHLAAGLVFKGAEQLRADAMRLLASVIGGVIMPDGGHVSRSPRDLLDLLAILAPLRNACRALRQDVDPAFHAAVERGFPMLRMLCHGDGGLALFNGADGYRAECVKSVLALDDVHGAPLAEAPQSGYCRMIQGDTLVIADISGNGAFQAPAAFELSEGNHRILTNCGYPASAGAGWQRAAQGCAAHNTVQFVSDGTADDEFRSGSAEVTGDVAAVARMIVSPHGSLLKASRPWHSANRTISHERDLFLASGGRDFRGEDRFQASEGAGRTSFAIRFHVHPSVKVSPARESPHILLVLPCGSAWQFSARGGRVCLEDSVFLGGSAPQRGSAQIVVRGIVGHPPCVHWAFKKLKRRNRTVVSGPQSEELPF